jgi:hypothetical protein
MEGGGRKVAAFFFARRAGRAEKIRLHRADAARITSPR